MFYLTLYMLVCKNLYLILDFLKGKLAIVQRHAWAESTIKTRQHQWRKYLSFCDRVKRDPFPLDSETTCLFFVHLAIHGSSYGTINNEASAINVFGKLHGGEIDIRMDYGVKLTLTALRRLLGDAPNRKDELLPSDLMQIYAQVNRRNFYEWSAWIGILFLYRTMLRKGHLFPGESDTNLLSCSSLKFTPYGMLVTVKKSKTIQFRQRQVDVPVCFGGGIFCIVQLLRDYFEHFPTVPTAPILSSFSEGSLMCVNYPQALSMLKRWGLEAGLQKKIGMHSLRRGAATLMSLGGFSLEDIKDRVDWRSATVLQYLAYPLPQKISIEKKIVLLLNNY